MRLASIWIILCLTISCDAVRIATYNIWNQMFNWKIRRMKISEEIKVGQIDIIGFQEVRGGFLSSSASQITELKSILPGRYRYSVYQPANNVTIVTDSISNDYPVEGVGLISSLPIVKTFITSLTPDRSDPDRNKRVILHAVIKDTSEKLLNVLVLHLSYHRQQQCKNIAEIISYIREKRLSDVIIVGDLNTYKDYEGPIKLLTEGKLTLNQCKSVLRNRDVSGFEPFMDAWLVVHPDKPGLTFSNMPHPGLESRPDRILVSQSMQVTSATLKGDGDHYKQYYRNSILVERFLTIARSSYLSNGGVKGYSCVQDCGPQGSCQCGVCVRGGANKGCLLPHCWSCDTNMHQKLVIYTVLFVILVIHVLYALFSILIIGSNSYGDSVYSILGFSCCLMSKDLFVTQFKSYKRKYKILALCRFWPIFRLSPYLQMLICLAGFLVMYFRFKVVFSPALDITYGLMEEEFFPSDHLLLTVDINV